MCTLTLAWQMFADAPVAAAANRDEMLDRPSEPPHVREIGDGQRTVAPRDARAGGTWIGVNDAGVLVAVTNRWHADEPDRGRSRGRLVDDCLARDSAEASARYVETAVREDDYAGFNLVVADADAALLLEWDGQLATTTLTPGVHVVVNVGGVINGSGRFTIPPDSPDRARRQAESARRFADAVRPEPGEDADSWLDRASEALGDHEYGVCVHGDDYGTRSASLLRVGTGEAPLRTTRYEFADGSPCTTPFEPVDL